MAADFPPPSFSKRWHLIQLGNATTAQDGRDTSKVFVKRPSLKREAKGKFANYFIRYYFPGHGVLACLEKFDWLPGINQFLSMPKNRHGYLAKRTFLH
jgi:hypothetical protein